MILTVFSDLINKIFSSFDSSLLGACHSAAGHAGAILTPLARAVTFIGEKGIIFFALALLLVMFKNAPHGCLPLWCGLLRRSYRQHNSEGPRGAPATADDRGVFRMVELCRLTCRGRLLISVRTCHGGNGGRDSALPLLPPQNDAARLHLRAADGILPLLPHGSLPLRCHGGCPHRRHLGSHCILHCKVDIHHA